MKCPFCMEERKRSRVYLGFSSTTAVAYVDQPFWDDDGNYHVHDRNVTTTTYSCSEGHKWRVKRVPKCQSCDFGHDREDVIERLEI